MMTSMTISGINKKDVKVIEFSTNVLAIMIQIFPQQKNTKCLLLKEQFW